jgi:hypothetical protein
MPAEELSVELETTTGVMLTLEQYNALQSRLALLEEMGAECAQDWQKIERLLARISALKDALEAAAGLRESDLDGADIYVHQWRQLLTANDTRAEHE